MELGGEIEVGGLTGCHKGGGQEPWCLQKGLDKHRGGLGKRGLGTLGTGEARAGDPLGTKKITIRTPKSPENGQCPLQRPPKKLKKFEKH